MEREIPHRTGLTSCIVICISKIIVGIYNGAIWINIARFPRQQGSFINDGDMEFGGQIANLIFLLFIVQVPGIIENKWRRSRC